MLEVLAGKQPGRRPIWFMRQAGRYLPEYREVRERAGSFLGLCYNPELASEVTLQPLRRYDLDAAILFADILVVPQAMGVGLSFVEGEGPKLELVSDLVAVGRLKSVTDSPEVRAVCGTVELVRSRLMENVALIGFCGGPWTVASYMVEGGGSNRERAKLAAFGREAWFVRLIERLVTESVEYLSAQIVAGVEIVQIFDSWAGDLPAGVREEFVHGPLEQLAGSLRSRHPNVPVIVFARGIGVDHPGLQHRTGAACMGIEAELPMSWAVDALDVNCAIQGNLDPVALLGSVEVAERETRAIVSKVPMARHVFNLGHGIRQGTRPEVLSAVIDCARRWDAENRAS